mmetsp:Transcript_26170/g.36003  ORF Transcript_26170/g.36003 Transcript_26170/m.36003 type:complete len:191 (+) Transcript_26170:329-901(+)
MDKETWMTMMMMMMMMAAAALSSSSPLSPRTGSPSASTTRALFSPFFSGGAPHARHTPLESTQQQQQQTTYAKGKGERWGIGWWDDDDDGFLALLLLLPSLPPVVHSPVFLLLCTVPSGSLRRIGPRQHPPPIKVGDYLPMTANNNKQQQQQQQQLRRHWDDFTSSGRAHIFSRIPPTRLFWWRVVQTPL